MPTLPSESTPTTDAQQSAPDEAKKKRNREIRQQSEACKTYRTKLSRHWRANADYRRGKPFATQTDQDRINVNIDWSMTKGKQALLFSQVPQIRISHPPQTLNPQVATWLHPYEQKVNDTLITAGVEAAMEEALPDCINAAGIGIIIVAREAITVDTPIPAMDLSYFPPEEQQQILSTQTLPDGSPLPMDSIPKVLDQRYTITRVSPIDFLWPANFAGSDFDNAPWIGRTGHLTWAEAKQRFNLNDADKNKYCGDVRHTFMDTLTYDVERDKAAAHDTVAFDEIFYREFQYDTEATSFQTIHHLVFLGKEQDPVVDEPWQGQRIVQDGSVVGCTKYPIRALTLTYMTDEAIPPSDSAIIRPQVNELNESRTQIILQRKHSLPVKWFDVNRVDPTIQQALMRGIWQSFVPVQGVGTNAIGEIPRASYPQENSMFYQMAKADIQELSQAGEPFSGGGIETKGEAQVVQTNMQTRITKERARVAKFVTSIAEVLGGLICLYEDPNSFGQGFDPTFSRTLSYSILEDSTVILDSNQRLQRLIQFVNFAAKSGWVNIEPVLREIATLSGLDPSLVIQPPQPKPPVEPNISLRLTGTEDLLNPLVLAFLMKSGQAPSTDLIDQAKQLIADAVQPTPGVPPVGFMDPNGPPGMGPADPNGAPGAPMPMPPAPPHPPVIAPSPPPPAIGDAHKQWNSMPRINRRTVDGHQEE